MDIIGVLQLISSPAIKAGKWTAKQIQRLYFRWGDRKSPFNEITALRIARSTLGGSIIAAIPFRNLGSKNQFLAVARREHDGDPNARIHILEQVGGAYMQIWVSDEIWGSFDQKTVEVVDLDNDGMKEVAFESASFGSGGGSKSLYIYSTKQSRVFEVEELYNYSNASTPDVYPIKIDAGTDEAFKSAMISYATSRGFLQGNELVDYDDPKFAILRWHKENGEKRSGKVSVHLYNGKPVYGASTHVEIDTGDLVWTAYFKGPLFGYIKSKDKHFIPYSPQWVYEWVKGLVDDGHYLWFVCHCVPGLFSFDYRANILKHYCGYAGYPLPDGDEVTYENNVLNFHTSSQLGGEGEIIELNDLYALMECRTPCLLNEAHLPNECLNRRHRENLETIIKGLDTK